MRSRLLLTVVCAFAVAGPAQVLAAAATDQRAPAAKPSSFAPEHTGRRVYGAPIQSPILHSRKKKPATHRRHGGASGAKPHAVG